MAIHVVFVAPYAMETTMRFVRTVARLEGVRLGVVSQEPIERFRSLGPGGADLLDGYAHTKTPLDAQALVEAVRSIARGPEWDGRVDRVIGVLEQLQEPLGEVREELGIRGMDSREATNFRDKSVMKDLLRANGLPCARHCLATTREEALAFADEVLPLVAKPPAGAGARNTARVSTKDELASYLRTLPPSKSQPLLLEEFIQGKEHSFDSITLGGRHVFHSISVYTPTPLEVMEHPWLQWCVVLPRHVRGDEYEDIYRAGPRALDVLGMVTGITHMEWFRRSDGSIAISEVAARPPGAQFMSLLSFAHDLDFYGAWARLMVFEEFTPPERTHAVGAVFLRGQGGGPAGGAGTDAKRVARVTGLDEIRRDLDGLVVQAKIPKPGSPAASDYEGEGFVIVRHPDTEVVVDAVRKVLSSLRVELETAPA